MDWAYGITTVITRKSSTLLKTLKSLSKAGFDNPRLFVDGVNSGYASLNLEVTYHYPTIGVLGNWYLALLELYIRNPLADRYAIFQDDIIASANLKQYLEQIQFPERGYLNLYTWEQNYQLANGKIGFYQTKQDGLGALALVFDLEAVTMLMSSVDFINRPKDPIRGKRCVDGSIVTALSALGYKEYVHNPSLVQHIGDKSSIGNPTGWVSPNFKGEEFNTLELLNVG